MMARDNPYVACLRIDGEQHGTPVGDGPSNQDLSLSRNLQKLPLREPEGRSLRIVGDVVAVKVMDGDRLAARVVDLGPAVADLRLVPVRPANPDVPRLGIDRNRARLNAGHRQSL